MRKLLTIFNLLYWAIYRLTPRGKKAWKFKKGLQGLLEKNDLRTRTKLRVVHSANKQLKPRKIISYFKGKSITKPKQSNFKVLESVKREHAEELRDKNLMITKKGKFRRK